MMTDDQARSPLRQLPLLPGEEVRQLFDPRQGLVTAPTQSGPLLALTNLRLALFQSDKRESGRDTTVAPLDTLGAVRISTSDRNLRILFQGLALMLVGIITYLAVGTFVVEGLLIPLAIGGGIVLVGVMFVLRYLFWEEEGKLTFQCGVRDRSGGVDRSSNWDLEFQYRSHQAAADAYRLVDGYFLARQGRTLPQATPPSGDGPVATAVEPPAEAQQPAVSGEAPSSTPAPEPAAEERVPAVGENAPASRPAARPLGQP